MLDLETRVHLHEVEIPLCIEQKLQRARALVVNRLCGTNRDLAHPRALRTDCRRWRLLNELLVPSLDRIPRPPPPSARLDHRRSSDLPGLRDEPPLALVLAVVAR